MQLSSDSRNVNLKLLNLMRENREEKNLPELLGLKG